MARLSVRLSVALSVLLVSIAANSAPLASSYKSHELDPNWGFGRWHRLVRYQAHS